jgi:prepilin-type N-terminal cleavage/methylation domain-containing protein
MPNAMRTRRRVTAGRGQGFTLVELLVTVGIVALLVGVWTALLAACGAAYIFTLACDLGTRGYLWMREQIDGENLSTVSGDGVR